MTTGLSIAIQWVIQHGFETATRRVIALVNVVDRERAVGRNIVSYKQHEWRTKFIMDAAPLDALRVLAYTLAYAM